MNKLLHIAAASLLLCSCSRQPSDTDKIELMVSIEPQRQLLEQLIDSSFTVTTLLDRGADPETFEPSMKQRAAAERARVFFGTGKLPFEEGIVDEERFVDTYMTVKPIYGTHEHMHSHSHEGEDEHEHEMPDPHVWTSISAAADAANIMSLVLIRQFPEKAGDIYARNEKLQAHLDSMKTAIAARLDSAGNRTFGIWHPSLSYFADEFGLKQITVGQEGKEMSARQVRKVIDEARADSVRVLFFQREFDSRQAQTINDGIGSRLVTIDPLAYDWEGQINTIVDELTRP